jgi:hypothetical protein
MFELTDESAFAARRAMPCDGRDSIPTLDCARDLRESGRVHAGIDTRILVASPQFFSSFV